MNNTLSNKKVIAADSMRLPGMAGIACGTKTESGSPPGKEYDTSGFVPGGVAAGLQVDYFGARYYDPEVGVFLGTDPENQYWSPYTFCGNNPVNAIDVTRRGAEALIEGVNCLTVYGHAAVAVGLTAAQITAISATVSAALYVATAYLAYTAID